MHWIGGGEADVAFWPKEDLPSASGADVGWIADCGWSTRIEAVAPRPDLPAPSLGNKEA